MTDAVLLKDPSHDAPARKCLACGYNLHGLGDEPRCPECGLLNIPDELRRQVWQQVDSGKWFFSSMFGPFRKRLPGWWWALDRPGDVSKSIKAAVRNIVAAIFLTALAFAVSTGIVLEFTTHYVSYDQNDPERRALDKAKSIYRIGSPWAGMMYEKPENLVDYSRLYQPQRRVIDTTTSKLALRRPRAPSSAAIGVLCGLVLTWAVPTFVGLCTQLRKDLPSFARAPRTILAAANYESHRLIYAAVLLGALTILEIFVRSRTLVGFRNTDVYELFCLSGLAMIVLFAAAGWVGPVRSDYTHQLVRSLIHAVRIVLMYGLVMPWILSWSSALYLALGV